MTTGFIYVNIDLRHQYGISAAESQTFLREKRPQLRRARRNGCFRRLQKSSRRKLLPIWFSKMEKENFNSNDLDKSYRLFNHLTHYKRCKVASVKQGTVYLFYNFRGCFDSISVRHSMNVVCVYLRQVKNVFVLPCSLKRTTYSSIKTPRKNDIKL